MSTQINLRPVYFIQSYMSDGMGWTAIWVMGLLRAPSVRIINGKKMESVKVFRLEFLTDILYWVSSIVHSAGFMFISYT